MPYKTSNSILSSCEGDIPKITLDHVWVFGAVLSTIVYTTKMIEASLFHPQYICIGENDALIWHRSAFQNPLSEWALKISLLLKFIFRLNGNAFFMNFNFIIAMMPDKSILASWDHALKSK